MTEQPGNNVDRLQQRARGLHEEWQRAVLPARAWPRGRRPSSLRSPKEIERELAGAQADLRQAELIHERGQQPKEIA